MNDLRHFDEMRRLAEDDRQTLEKGLARLEMKGYRQSAQALRRLLLEGAGPGEVGLEFGSSPQRAAQRLRSAEALLLKELRPEITLWLIRWQQGDTHARELVWEHEYADFKKRVAVKRGLRAAGRCGCPTSIVNEAFVRLERAVRNRKRKESGSIWKDRSHFEAYVDVVLSNLIWERGRKRERRAESQVGGPDQRAETSVAAEGSPPIVAGVSEEIVDVRSAQAELNSRQPQWAAVLRCRLTEGRTIDETAELLRISSRTVKRHLHRALAFLRNELVGGKGGRS